MTLTKGLEGQDHRGLIEFGVRYKMKSISSFRMILVNLYNLKLKNNQTDHNRCHTD